MADAGGDPDEVFAREGHAACGWVAGFAPDVDEDGRAMPRGGIGPVPVGQQDQVVKRVGAVQAFVAEGALLGQLWMEGQLGVGDPLVNQGAPTRPLPAR